MVLLSNRSREQLAPCSGSVTAAAVPKKRAPKVEAAQGSQSTAEVEPTASAAAAASKAAPPAEELSLMDRLAGQNAPPSHAN